MGQIITYKICNKIVSEQWTIDTRCADIYSSRQFPIHVDTCIWWKKYIRTKTKLSAKLKVIKCLKLKVVLECRLETRETLMICCRTHVACSSRQVTLGVWPLCHHLELHVISLHGGTQVQGQSSRRSWPRFPLHLWLPWQCQWVQSIVQQFHAFVIYSQIKQLPKLFYITEDTLFTTTNNYRRVRLYLCNCYVKLIHNRLIIDLTSTSTLMIEHLSSGNTENSFTCSVNVNVNHILAWLK